MKIRTAPLLFSAALALLCAGCHSADPGWSPSDAAPKSSDASTKTDAANKADGGPSDAAVKNDLGAADLGPADLGAAEVD